jgi:hypothetical protein
MRIIPLSEERALLVEAIRKVESRLAGKWDTKCPVCGRYVRRYGHIDSCVLGRAIDHIDGMERKELGNG